MAKHTTSINRARFLTTVGTAMVATMTVGAAHAADTTVTPTGPLIEDVDTTVLGNKTLDTVLGNMADILAEITGSDGGVGTEESPGGTSSIAVDGNDIKAVALGNNFDNSIDLYTIDNDIDGDGAASLGVEVNLGSVTATIDNSQIYADLADFSGGTVGVNGNDIEADATGNAGSTTLAGAIPNGYATSATDGSSTMNSAGPDFVDANGSLVASTIQMNIDPDIEGSVESDIYLDLESTGDNTVAGSPEVIGNRAAASAQGNSSNSTIDIQSGGAPTFTGSAVVSNGQSNVDTTGSGEIYAYNYTYIDGDVDADTGTNTLTGTLSVQDNVISASASGNEALGTASGQAGNRILLADGMSFAGAGSAGATADIEYDSAAVESVVTADLVINNSQGNVGEGNSNRFTIEAYVEDGSRITGEAQELVGGTVDVSGNAITATARGNTASSALNSGEGAASFVGTASVANQQTNLYTDVDSEIYYAELWGWAGDNDADLLTDSTILVDGNRIAASAYGNQVSQTVALEANELDFGDAELSLTGGTGGAVPDGNLHAAGGVIVSNLQSIYSSDIDAYSESAIDVGSYSDEVDNSTIQGIGNTQEAIALGNSGANALSIAGTIVDSNAGIASVQIVADDSSIEADSYSTLDLEADQVNGSSLELSGNLNRAIAYGASVSNTLNVDANEITVDDDDMASMVTYNVGEPFGFVLDYADGEAPVVNSPYGVLNVQTVSAQISAENDASQAIALDVNESLGAEDEGSSAINDGNTVVAAAYGTDSLNRGGLTVGTLDTGDVDPDYSAVLNVTNAQTLATASTVTAEVYGSRTVNTDINDGEGDVVESSVSTSSNTIQALAYGNLTDNGVSASGTNIDTEADYFGGGSRGSANVENLVATTDASFSINNVQAADGTISAALLDVSGPSSASEVLTDIGDDVSASSVVSNGNALAATVTGNRAANAVSVTGNELATTSALTNLQISEADISAQIGIEGGPATPGGTFPFHIDGVGLGHDSVNEEINAGEFSIDTTGFDPELIAYLLDNGWSSFGPNEVRQSAVGYPATIPEYSDIATNGIDDFAVIPASLGTPNEGGVRVAIGGDVDASTIAVNGNSIAGSVTGNSATNSVSVAANSVPDGSSYLWTEGVVDGLNTEVLADHMVSNVQVVGEASLDSTVYGTFAIDMPDEASDISDSSLTVDGNSQSARAVANTASNSIDLEATNTASGSALASNQFSEASVSALSNVDIFAPVASDNTSVSMSDNTNLAVGVINDVTNRVTVDTTNAEHATVTVHSLLVVDAVDEDMTAYGDHVLLNQQVAVTSANADAVSTIYNQDGTFLSTDGITDGSVTISGNRTTSEASANRASNTLSANAGASMDAAVGLVNAQVSYADVTSTATTSAGVTLAGDALNTDAAVDGGSVTLGSNTTSALARGNAATNVLNYSAGANYGTPGGIFDVAATTTGLETASVDARAAVLNVQYNDGSVSASSTDASYVVALNSDAAPAPGITNATIGVIGNSVSATAYGNTARNALSVAPLNTGMPSASIGNVQFNEGPVTASVTTVTYGITSGLGAVAGSSLQASGNQVTATAIGNNAVSSITAGQ